MNKTRKFLRVATLVASGTLLACVDEVTVPNAPAPVSPVFTSLEIQSPTKLVAIAGLNTSRIEVRAKDQNGNSMIVERGSFTISSNHPNVAVVTSEQFWTSDSNGTPDDSWIAARVEAIAPGEAVISVSWTIGGVTKTAKSTISVESTEGWSLNISPAPLTVQLGSTQLVRASIMDAHGTTRIPYVALTSDRDDVALVIEHEWCLDWWPCDGVDVRGVGLGEATLTARFQFLSATVVVTVVPSS